MKNLPSNILESNIENRLEFLRSHRGTVTQQGDSILVESEKKESTFLMIGKTTPPTELLRKSPACQLSPWSASNEKQLNEVGFSLQSGLTYMLLEEKHPAWEIMPNLTIQTVSVEARCRYFTRT